MSSTTIRLKSYLLEERVPGGSAEANHACDTLIAAYNKLYNDGVEASGVGKHRAFIRYRAADDQAARRVAAELLGEAEDYMVTTGYGMHRRIVRDYSAS